MGALQDLQLFAARVDAATNALALATSKIQQMITDLQAQVSLGQITPQQVADALAPVATHLEAVTTTLTAIAAGGATTVPPPIEPL